MGIGVQGESCGEVTQHAGHRLDVHSVLECDGCEGVAEVMESDLRDASPFEDTLKHIIHAARGDGSTVGRGEHILVIQRPRAEEEKQAALLMRKLISEKAFREEQQSIKAEIRRYTQFRKMVIAYCR